MPDGALRKKLVVQGLCSGLEGDAVDSVAELLLLMLEGELGLIDVAACCVLLRKASRLSSPVQSRERSTTSAIKGKVHFACRFNCDF